MENPPETPIPTDTATATVTTTAAAVEYPGARWWKFDIHTHTPASSDYGAGPDQMALKARTHRQWLMDFLNAGVECVAVTDHHSGAWIDPLKTELEAMRTERVPGSERLFLFPGVELSIGGTHFLAIFDPSATSAVITNLLARARYNDAPNNAQGFCEQTNTVEVCEEVTRLGGIVIPAHVDLQSSGLFRAPIQAGVLTPLFSCEHIHAVELVDRTFVFPALYTDSRTKWAALVGSDSHHPTAPPAGTVRRPSFPGSHFTWVKMGHPSLAALKLALQDGNEFSLIRSDERDAGFNPNKTPHEWIESLEVSNALLMGLGAVASYRFNPWMNAIIGGRGSGKSTLVHFIRATTMRGTDLQRLGEGNRVSTTFENFLRVGGRRPHEIGGLRDDTKISIVYRKGESRFRLTWPNGRDGTKVETIPVGGGDWETAESQDVIARFPLQIFSQDEIGLIAERPEALLARVDESIAKADWQADWNETENRFMLLVAEIRLLKSQLSEKDRLTGELEDLVRQLATFGQSEHASVRKDFQKYNRQESELDRLFADFDALAMKVGDFQGEMAIEGLPADFVGEDETKDVTVAAIERTLQEGVAEVARILGEIRNNMVGISSAQREALTQSEWRRVKAESDAAHAALVTALQAEGVEDPAAFTTMVSRRQTLEAALREIEGIEAQITTLTESVVNCRDTDMLELRHRLRTMRREFLRQGLGDNAYVQIQLNAFGDPDDRARVESDLRRILGCEDGRFADAIYDSERNRGIVADLYQGLPEEEDQRIEILLSRISDWKGQVVNASLGIENSLPGKFQNYISVQTANRPGFIDKLLVWYPEDSLVVRYSRGGRGTHFVPLSQGSAGEKAAALLAFFLADGETPLVLDQPENDLDNHLISDLVVSQLKENKVRRQIIVVTHNPNIVVNGDAEQVCAMNFAGGQCRSKAAGSLQDEAVRTEVCEVMEGGRNALRSRFRRLI